MAAAETPAPTHRIAAIDWMRGIVMILMVLDHASLAFNADHLSLDSAALYEGEALPAFPFLSRWITHLCAPTFVFLAGTALALSVERRVQRGERPGSIDRQILTRGLIIALLDPFVLSVAVGAPVLQVLWAIGLSMMLMAPLRRLPTMGLVALGLGWIFLGELATDPFWNPELGERPRIVVAMTMAALFHPLLRILYPILPWLAMMALGWAFGRYLLGRLAAGDTAGPRRAMALMGVAGLWVFAIVRGLNDYGNMFLLRTDGTLVQWLHVSKYPPALAFTSLELGLLGLCLAGLMALEPRIGVRRNGPLLVFGQTALFFYLVHRLVFDVTATWLGMRRTGDLADAYLVTAASLLLLYPACRWYRGLKARHPTSPLRYF